jgi:hypothetical protein
MLVFVNRITGFSVGKDRLTPDRVDPIGSPEFAQWKLTKRFA